MFLLFLTDTTFSKGSFLQENGFIPEGHLDYEILSINQSFTKRTENWENITQHSFVLSPFGMGMDCHRTWEALCLGAIPIVKAPNFQKMFEDLPVLIVNDWFEITRELLDKTIEDFKNREFKYEKLTLQYWKTLIKNPTSYI